MIHNLPEIAGAAAGIAVTAALFILNIVRLIRGRRIFRAPRSLPPK